MKGIKDDIFMKSKGSEILLQRFYPWKDGNKVSITSAENEFIPHALKIARRQLFGDFEKNPKNQE